MKPTRNGRNFLEPKISAKPNMFVIKIPPT